MIEQDIQRSPVKLSMLVFGAAILAALYLSSRYSYLLFHSLAEIFSVVIGGCIFIIAWNSRRFMENGYLLLLGIASLFVGGFDILHALAFKGMGVFTGSDANLPTQLWVAGRYVQSFSLLVAPLFLRYKVNARWLLLGYSLVSTLLVAAIFVWQVFPVAYVEGQGLTPFKIISEYIIICIYLAGLFLLYRAREHFEAHVMALLAISVAAGILAEVAFTNYVGVFDFANLLGHFFKIGAFYYLYKAIIETGFVRPYDLLFRDLQQRNAQLTLALQEQEYAKSAMRSYARRLESSNRELQDFAFIASHDLKEPLRKIQAFGERLVDRAAHKLDVDEQDYLKRMQSGAARMSAMIDDLLSLSRVTTRAHPFVETDLNQVLREVLSDLEVSIERSRGRVDFGDLPVIEADPSQMHQLFQNLVANGLKFHKPEEPPVVQVHCRRLPPLDGQGEQVEISVSDQGIGFDMKNADLIFQPFQRLVGRSEYEGSGIGLAVCRKIVERHNGTLEAESVLGQGSTFRVRLPVKMPGNPAESINPSTSS